MLHAMLWNEIHALQSVPPPLPARATSAWLCSNKEHARRRTETKTNEISTPTERRRGERRGSGDDPKYSLLEYALRGARANGLVRASLLNRQGVEVRAGAPRSQRVSHLGVSGVRAP